MVDFDRDRDANLSAFELTGGSAHGGLTVRDYFAAKALPTVMEISAVIHYESRNERIKEVASISYAMADAMMQERDKPQQKAVSVEEAFGLEK